MGGRGAPSKRTRVDHRQRAVARPSWFPTGALFPATRPRPAPIQAAASNASASAPVTALPAHPPQSYHPAIIVVAVRCDRVRALALAAVLAVGSDPACGGNRCSERWTLGRPGDGLRRRRARRHRARWGCDPRGAKLRRRARSATSAGAGTTAVVGCWPSPDGGRDRQPVRGGRWPCGRGTGCIATAATSRAAAALQGSTAASDGRTARPASAATTTGVAIACGTPATSLALHFCY